MEASSQPQSDIVCDDIVVLSDSELKEKNFGRPFTDIWKYIKRGKSRGNGHYEGTCNFCGKKWSKGKPTSLKAYITNHCTGINIPANVKSYFIKILANENEKKREYSDSESESNQNNENIKRQKIANNRKSSIGSGSTNINNHFQKKEKLNSNRVKEIDYGLVQAFVCYGIPL